MRIVADITEGCLGWIQFLDSSLGINLDDSLSVLVYNMESSGDDSWINFMTQMVEVEGSTFPLYEIIEDTLENDLSENAHDLLNNPLDQFMISMGYSINKILKVKVTKTIYGEVYIFAILEVSDDNK